MRIPAGSFRSSMGKPIGGIGGDLGTLVPHIAAFVPGQHHGLQGRTVSGRTGLDAHGVTDRAAAELQHYVLPQTVDGEIHGVQYATQRRFML